MPGVYERLKSVVLPRSRPGFPLCRIAHPTVALNVHSTAAITKSLDPIEPYERLKSVAVKHGRHGRVRPSLGDQGALTEK